MAISRLEVLSSSIPSYKVVLSLDVLDGRQCRRHCHLLLGFSNNLLVLTKARHLAMFVNYS